MIPANYKDKSRYFISERSAAGGASLTRTRTWNLQAAGFNFMTNGNTVIVIDNLWVNTAYELAASPNGFQSCGASVEFTGLNDASNKQIREPVAGGIDDLFFPAGIQLLNLNIELSNVLSPLTLVVTIEPGTAILAAAINSIRVQIGIGIDVYSF